MGEVESREVTVGRGKSFWWKSRRGEGKEKGEKGNVIFLSALRRGWGRRERERNAEPSRPTSPLLLFYLRGALQNQIYLKFGFGISSRESAKSTQSGSQSGKTCAELINRRRDVEHSLLKELQDFIIVSYEGGVHCLLPTQKLGAHDDTVSQVSRADQTQGHDISSPVRAFVTSNKFTQERNDFTNCNS
ncbi:hypothetical protein J6590_034747 [Homalodisca vitripennis]|nr:hypothetical protein J6590_034747 [Homalodisca vitripennis]